GELTGSVVMGVNGGVGPYTYSWSPNIGNCPRVNNIAAGSYTLNVTDRNGCIQQSAIAITEPTALRAGIKTKVCQGPIDGIVDVKVVGGTAPYTYSWAPGGGTSAYMAGLSTGTYTITVTDSHNCFDTLTVTFDCVSTGDNQLTNSSDINVYPNPSNGQFNVAGVTEGMNIEVYDYAGKLISNTFAGNETMKLDMSTQPNGLYLVRILSKEQALVSQKKLVKAN
ncbi:MAG TPA: T9SS type A sorting domain-containing protein, partial [Bacteroidia bacterium]|nr:T9SS type A sorting domain-containing protein [Bacteroidia bacterium]